MLASGISEHGVIPLGAPVNAFGEGLRRDSQRKHDYKSGGQAGGQQAGEFHTTHFKLTEVLLIRRCPESGCATRARRSGANPATWGVAPETVTVRKPVVERETQMNDVAATKRPVTRERALHALYEGS